MIDALRARVVPYALMTKGAAIEALLALGAVESDFEFLKAGMRPPSIRELHVLERYWFETNRLPVLHAHARVLSLCERLSDLHDTTVQDLDDLILGTYLLGQATANAQVQAATHEAEPGNYLAWSPEDSFAQVQDLARYRRETIAKQSLGRMRNSQKRREQSSTESLERNEAVVSHAQKLLRDGKSERELAGIISARMPPPKCDAKTVRKILRDAGVVPPIRPRKKEKAMT